MCATMTPIQHPQEKNSNAFREEIARTEPKSLRTFTPTQAILARSAGIYHWTPEDRRLFDFSSGVLVANLGHNPVRWMQRFSKFMGWPEPGQPFAAARAGIPAGYYPALPMTAYNGITPIEVQASQRLIQVLQKSPGGKR